MKVLLAIVIGYLLGSVPFALVIGKIFYKKDIRQFGSGNLGGSNAGRVLGKKAGLSVMALDLLKVTLAIWIASLLDPQDAVLTAAGVAAAAGHCFPVFAKFKGGKAVATMYGFLFGMALIGGYSFWIFFFPLIAFLVILYVTKIVSASSMLSAAADTIFIYVTTDSKELFWGALIFTVLMILRHKSNLERIFKHQENKIKWM